MVRKDFLLEHSQPPVPVLVEYYQPAFELLHERLHEQVQEALLSEPASIRAKYLTENLPIGEEISPECAWPVARELLDMLEAAMAAVLRTRSVFFWLHLYRRIGVFLHPLHEDKTDPRTLALVRQITELAISKYGRATDAREIVLSSRVNPDLILGGLMRAGMRKLATKRPNKTYRNLAKALRAQPQWVIRDFSENDFLGIYRVEGLAYQFWRVTALLRSLGKGARIAIDRHGDWDYVSSEEFLSLVKNIDARTDRGGFDKSLLGIWIDETVTKTDMGEKAVFDQLICPFYNVHRVKLGDAFSAFGLLLPQDFASNFVPALVDVRRFLQAHDFLSDAFKAKLGYRIEAFLSVLLAINNIVYFPNTVLLAETEKARRKMLQQTLMSILQRGYRVLKLDTEEIAPELRRRIEWFDPGLKVTEHEIRTVLGRLTLTPEAQGSISLWSGGPRHVLIPAGEHQAVNLESVPMILYTMFVGVAHNQGRRGTVFEETFRQALSNRGFEVRYGRLRSFAGAERELDAGVVVGDVLYAFECVSVERPLDYEIGNIATFRRRRERLDDKVLQALTLADFLRAEPRGTNYDFMHVTEIVPLVVSPFEEWIWDRSDRLWLRDGTPRILSAREARDLLEDARRKRQADVG